MAECPLKCYHSGGLGWASWPWVRASLLPSHWFVVFTAGINGRAVTLRYLKKKFWSFSFGEKLLFSIYIASSDEVLVTLATE